MYSDLGAQSTIAAGGRYDVLVQECGGPPMPGVGFAAGMERLLLTLEDRGWQPPTKTQVDVFVAGAGETRSAVVNLTFQLRSAGLAAEIDYGDRGLRAQMRAANRLNAAYAVIIGEEELASRRAMVRDMASGQQYELPIDDIEDWLMNQICTSGHVVKE